MIKVIESSDLTKFENQVKELLKNNWKISSTSCGFVNSENYNFCSSYQAILILRKKKKRILVSDWLDEHPEISRRIYNALTNEDAVGHHRWGSDNRPFKYMDEVNEQYFLRCRNTGAITWYEFTKLIKDLNN